MAARRRHRVFVDPAILLRLFARGSDGADSRRGAAQSTGFAGAGGAFREDECAAGDGAGFADGHGKPGLVWALAIPAAPGETAESAEGVHGSSRAGLAGRTRRAGE